MDKKLTAAIVGFLLLVGVFALYIGIGLGQQAQDQQVDSHSGHKHSHGTATSTAQPASIDEAPEAVQESYDGATALKENLSTSGYSESRVQISRQGEIVVFHKSSASNGPELKKEMFSIAEQYAAAVEQHNSTGGLTVHSNGVTMMVSSDAAKAYAEGRLKENAFKQTFYWESQAEGE